MNTLSDSFSVMFHLRPIKSQDGKLPVYARVTVNGKRIEISLKQKFQLLTGTKEREWQKITMKNVSG
jgi:hypothetical protein